MLQRIPAGLGITALLLVVPCRAEPLPAAPPPPSSSSASGAELLGPIRLDESARRSRSADIPVTLGNVKPSARDGAPARYRVEEGVVFEPQLQEDPSSRLEFKGMFRMDLKQ